MAITDHDTEDDTSFKYLGTVSNITNDETEEIKDTITAANKAYNLCTVPLDVNISTEIIKYDYMNINEASAVLQKCNMEPNTNDRKGKCVEQHM